MAEVIFSITRVLYSDTVLLKLEVGWMDKF